MAWCNSCILAFNRGSGLCFENKRVYVYTVLTRKTVIDFFVRYEEFTDVLITKMCLNFEIEITNFSDINLTLYHSHARRQ